MATSAPTSTVAHIGVTAGVAWRVLDQAGPMSMAKLVQAVGEPRDAVMLALGWLAREDKICIETEGRKKVVSRC